MLLDVTAAWERQTVGRERRKVIQNYISCLQSYYCIPVIQNYFSSEISFCMFKSILSYRSIKV